MKHLEELKQFEKEFNTQIIQFSGGIMWVIDDNTYVMKTEALGIYKRYKLDLFKVLKIVTFNKNYNGTERSALQLSKKLIKDKKRLDKKIKEMENEIK